MPDNQNPPASVSVQGGHTLLGDPVPGHDLASLAHYVAELAGASVRPHVFRVEGDPQATWLSTKEGLRRVPHEADQSCFEFEDLEPLAEALAGLSRHPLAVAPAMFLHRCGATVHFNAVRRRDRASCTFCTSPAWVLFESMPENQPFKVPAKDVLRIVRQRFGLDASSPIYAAFARLKFQAQRSMEVARSARTSSLGHSVEQAAEGAQEIPETFKVEAKAWTGIAWAPTVSVPVNVWIDHDNSSIDFWVRAEDLEELLQESLVRLKGRMEGCLARLRLYETSVGVYEAGEDGVIRELPGAEDAHALRPRVPVYLGDPGQD